MKLFSKLKRFIRLKISNFIGFDKSEFDVDIIIKKVIYNKIQACERQVTLGLKSYFYEGAEVHNLQKDISKIIIGNNTHIKGELLIYPYGKGISIGKECYLGKYSVIRAADCIRIGDYVLIAHNVTIIDTDSHELNYIERKDSYKEMLKSNTIYKKGNVKTAPIIINDNVWISYNVCVLKGVTIGKGAIVAAGSVVTKDVQPFTLVAGNPAVKIKDLNDKENN